MNSSHLFPNAEKAPLFLGTLAAVFLFSYPAGLLVSGIIVFDNFWSSHNQKTGAWLACGRLVREAVVGW